MRSAKIGFRHTRGEHFPEMTIVQLRENLDAAFDCTPGRSKNCFKLRAETVV